MNETKTEPRRGFAAQVAAQLGGELEGLCQTGAAREDLFRALLRQVSDPGTLNVIIIEDIHWADEATIDLLRFLGRRLRDAPVLLIVTYRDEGLAADDPLRIALGDLTTQRPTRRVRLAPLSVDAVRMLAEGSGLKAAELYRLTGGNPFYVTEVVQAGLGAVPASARDAVLARAARLGGGSREVLDVAALIGARVELDLLTSATGCPPAAVDEILASGLLAEDGGWLKFRHEIARLAVEQAIPAHRVLSSTPASWLPLARWDTPTMRGWRFTPRRRVTGRWSCTMRRVPRGRRLSWPHTGRRPRNTSAPCGLPPALTWPWSPGCMTGLPSS
jgi:hypothetical protein